MLRRLHSFAINQRFFFILSSFFALYLSAFFLGRFIHNFPIYFINRFGGLFFSILGTGIAITLILQWITKRIFEKWEFISIALATGLIIPPVILEIEYLVNYYVYDWFPIINALVLWIIAGILLFYKRTFFSFSLNLKKIKFNNPLSIILIFGFFFVLVQTLMYKTLPDLDPYKWLLKYIYQFSNHQLDYAERPLFGALVFIGTRFTGIGLETFFKYIIPFLNLTILFPAWMVARTFNNTKKQLVFLIFIFSGPATILYTLTSIPQATLITIIYFIVFFLIYSSEKNNSFFFYISGIIAFFSFFFHQAGAILIAVWFIVFIISDFKFIFKDKKTLFLISLLIITNFSKVKPITDFALSWTRIIITGMFSTKNINLLYPFRYRNVDLTIMGWGSWEGVLKFYAFYMGPAVGILVILFLLLFLSQQDFRALTIKKIKSDVGLASLVLMFLIFFTIAEILPRFPNIALLPDRAWVFSGIFSFLFLYLILKYIKNISDRSFFIFISIILIGLSGGSYINYLKRYLITPAQLESAEWIKNNLPNNRVFLSYGHKSLLPIYANSSVIRIPADIYCSKKSEDFENIINLSAISGEKNSVLEGYYKPFLNTTKSKIDESLENYKKTNSVELRLNDALSTMDTIINNAIDTQSDLIEISKSLSIINPPTQSIDLSSPLPIESVYELKKIPSFNSIKNDPLYIYFAKEHKLNPYRMRPYEMETWGIEPCSDGKFLFDLYPNKFKRVYYSKNEEVIIWKVL